LGALLAHGTTTTARVAAALCGIHGGFCICICVCIWIWIANGLYLRSCVGQVYLRLAGRLNYYRRVINPTARPPLRHFQLKFMCNLSSFCTLRWSSLKDLLHYLSMVYLIWLLLPSSIFWSCTLARTELCFT